LFSLTTFIIFSVQKFSSNEWNHSTTSRWGLGTDKYWIATEEEAFFRKATKVTIACGYSNAFWIL
jgi:hypothetical protein